MVDFPGQGRGSNADHGVEKFGDVPDTPTVRTALISGNTFAVKAVQYLDLEGMAIVEGDIALGAVAEVEDETARVREMSKRNVAFGVGVTGDQFRWPDRRIPYEIDPRLPNPARVTDAIAHWESRTAFQFVARTAESDWVRFEHAAGCWSHVGMRGGRQNVGLGPNCTVGNAIHEIAHTIGLWHEQSREDRDQYVAIMWQNIQQNMLTQFAQHITDGDDLGAYDYASIMHYPRNAFTKNGQDTISPLDPAAQIGRRDALSDGDLHAVIMMYPDRA